MPTVTRAVAKINQAGALLVFPVKERSEYPSLWSAFYPGEEMDWDWSVEGDDRVPRLWHLRTELSTSRQVIYSKWFRDRATCFSLELFTAMLSLVSNRSLRELKLSREAERVLSAVQDDSPMATRELKIVSDLQGRENNAAFDRAMKELWRKFLVVGYGEVEEGGYPSLAVGSSKALFEDLWDSSRSISESERRDTLERFYPAGTAFHKQFRRYEQALLLS